MALESVLIAAARPPLLAGPSRPGLCVPAAGLAAPVALAPALHLAHPGEARGRRVHLRAAALAAKAAAAARAQSAGLAAAALAAAPRTGLGEAPRVGHGRLRRWR
jgi:hypothetical protein